MEALRQSTLSKSNLNITRFSVRLGEKKGWQHWLAGKFLASKTAFVIANQGGVATKITSYERELRLEFGKKLESNLMNEKYN